jgi:hypothetical protein
MNGLRRRLPGFDFSKRTGAAYAAPMTTTIFYIAAVFAGLAVIASPLIIGNGTLRSWAVAIGLSIVAAAIIHAIAP